MPSRSRQVGRWNWMADSRPQAVPITCLVVTLGAVCLEDFGAECGVAVVGDWLDFAEALDDLNQRGQLRRAVVAPARHRAAYPRCRVCQPANLCGTMLCQVDRRRLQPGCGRAITGAVFAMAAFAICAPACGLRQVPDPAGWGRCHGGESALMRVKLVGVQQQSPLIVLGSLAHSDLALWPANSRLRPKVLR